LAEEIQIEFDFIVAKVQSMADGSPRLILDLPEKNMPQAMLLWDAKLRDKYLHAVVTEEQGDKFTL
jgi:hypothetical protein